MKIKTFVTTSSVIITILLSLGGLTYFYFVHSEMFPAEKWIWHYISVSLASIFIIIIVYYFLLDSITKPIQKLRDNIEEITKGNMEIKLEKSNISEIQDLTDSLNRILASLKLAILRTDSSKEELGLGEAMKEREEARQLATSERDKLKAILDSTQAGIAITDHKHNILEANNAFCKILGYSLKEIKKLTFRDFTHPDDLKKSVKLVQQLKSGKIKSFKIRKKYIRKDKKTIFGEVKVTSIKDRSGKFLYNIVSLEEIPEKAK